MAPEIWQLDGVLAELADINAHQHNRSFVFVLGAGASFSSGIPTGKHLAEQWLRELHLRLCPDQNLDMAVWLQGDPLGISGLSFDRAAEFYPQIFERRFRGNPDMGYAVLEKAMEGKEPSLGYALLAEIIQYSRHRVVITTNFDNLVADALAMHAHQSPLVVGHESLVGFVQTAMRRPLVAKIHRDLFLAPINNPAGVQQLQAGWPHALSKLFQTHTPIVIGYGGNDGSLMGLLENLPAGEIAGRMVWCTRDPANVSAATSRVLAKHQGLLVAIDGFDEFMLQLASKLVNKFDLSAIAERTANIGRKRAENYMAQAKTLAAVLFAGSRQQQAAGKVLAESAGSGNTWWSWQMQADAEPDLDKRQAIYEEGLKRFPGSAELHGNYALFLKNFRRDYERAEALYQKALELDPENAGITGNYAVFLKNCRHNYDGAEALYQKTLELGPEDANHASNYAVFLTDIRHEYDRAEALYRKALELDPEHANNTGNYASFLRNIRRDYDRAEALYRKALELDPEHANITGNYANFLTDIRHDHDAAEVLYRKALALNPEDANVTGNYALFLTDIRHDHDGAEALYRKALALNPEHTNHTSNYAYFLATIRHDHDAAEALYHQALALDPEDANIKANYAALLLTRAAAGDLAQAAQQCRDALVVSSTDQTAAEVLLYAGLCAELGEVAVERPLARLKALLQQGYPRGSWDFAPMFAQVLPRLPAERAAWYRALGAAILDAGQLPALEATAEWQAL